MRHKAAPENTLPYPGRHGQIRILYGWGHPCSVDAPEKIQESIVAMNQNINFWGILILLRALRTEGVLTENEAQAITARIAVETGVTVQISL